MGEGHQQGKQQATGMSTIRFQAAGEKYPSIGGAVGFHENLAACGTHRIAQWDEERDL
jgi:hypothetical protein